MNEHGDRVPLGMITIANDSGGGQPVSLAKRWSFAQAFEPKVSLRVEVV